MHPTGLPQGDGSRRCGACAWYADGCLAAALGDDPPVPVPADAAACALFEPPVSCDPCGACCREAFDSVPVTDEDEARLGENAHLVRRSNDGWRDLARVGSPTGRGTRCAALRGDGCAAPYRCVVYAVRPTNCRELDAGSPACLTARRRVGLSPWPPGITPHGPLFSEDAT